ncbi:MAG: hypothetical protein RIB65_03495 [Ilumatobacter fluminis]|uniref:hypothetical protein n=1 Tax=Ilumatobacter fluminis TaxID=467091 RepID=UPI0032ED9700
MATIANVEKRIYEIEGFEVRVRHSHGGRDVRSDKSNVKQYPYKRALKHSKNVKAWREGRFASTYPGYSVEVLDADGQVAHGGTLLGTVRDGYLADE